jgi:transposase InsO family protein
VIDHLRKDFGVEPVCRELGLSASAYWARKKRPPSARFCRDAEILVHIRRIHDESLGTYGAHRVYKQLRREGHQIARCTIERLMRAHGIEGVVRGRKRKATIADPAASRPTDLVNRDFTADRPCGSLTSPTSTPGTGGCTSRSSPTCTPARSSRSPIGSRRSMANTFVTPK